MTNEEVIEHIKKSLNRKEELIKEIESTDSWWYCQLNKHRPDLAKERDANQQELDRLNRFLKRVGP